MKTLKNKKLVVSRETITSLNGEKIENLNNVKGGNAETRFTRIKCIVSVIASCAIC